MGHTDRQVTRLATRWQIPACLVDSSDGRRGEELAETGLAAHRGTGRSFNRWAMGDEGKEIPETDLRGERKQQQKKDGIKTNDEMEVTRGVVVGWTVWTRVDVEPNEAKV